MNIKKTIFALALLVLVLPVLMLPASAASEYVFNGSSSGRGFCAELLPEGEYTATLIFNEDGSTYKFFSDAFTVEYSESPGGSCSELDVYFDFYEEKDKVTLTFYLTDDFTACSILLGTEECAFEGVTLIVTPVYTPLSIISVVNSDLLSGTLDEVVSLLPIILSVIVCFIGIRKGISYLQSFLHQA